MSGEDGQLPPQRAEQIIGPAELAAGIENDRYKHLLDNAPVAIAVSRGCGAEQQVTRPSAN
jgi:hypothetical protein